MSLYLGNLSPHIRHAGLERVFRRFGCSNVQLKDGYGFVVFEDPRNAERALRALRGKLICGERISLTWSNRQPRPFQRSTRSARIPKRNVSREGDNGVRNRSSPDQRDISADIGNYLNKNHEQNEHRHEYTDDLEEEQNLKEGILNDGIASEPNPVENDRWGEPVEDLPNDNGAENGTELDRYEPYCGFDKKNETNQQQMAFSHDSGGGNSSERPGRDNSGFYNPGRQKVCYNCGMVGHKMRYCPKADASRRGFGRRQDATELTGRNDRRVKKQRSTSWARLRVRDFKLSRRHSNERKERGSWKPHRLNKRNDNPPENRDNHRSQFRRDSRGKKICRKEDGSPKKHHVRKKRASDPNSTVSSDSRSSSSMSVSGISSRSCSRSVSSESRSVSSTSRSDSLSDSLSHSSRSRSRSSRSLSPSVSLGPQSPSSKNAEIDQTPTLTKDGTERVAVPKSEDVSLEHRSSVGNDGKQSFEHKNLDTVQELGINEMQPEGALTGNKSCLPDLREMDSHKDSERSQIDLVTSPFKMLQTGNTLKISSQELCMVLKHYGLKVPGESELNLPVNAYFGAARLWPWQMVYYRRLKKGPISTENYARRLAQNREFGIVDKYIRSSSGFVGCDGSKS